MLSTPTRLAQAAVPNDAVVVNLSGSLTAMSSAPAFSPAFSVANTDYAIYCKSGVNIITLTFGGVHPANATVSLGENQALVVASRGQQYWIRCLPHDFPVLHVAGSGSGYYLTGNLNPSTAGTSSPYAMVLNGSGAPVWYRKVTGGPVNVEALANDTVAWMPLNGPGIGVDASIGYELYQLDTQTTTTVFAPLKPTDPHELFPMANGDYMVIGSQVTQLSTPFDYAGTTYSAIVDCVVQEVTSRGTLMWSWQASHHVALSEVVHGAGVAVNGQQALDAFHCNSVDVDAGTSNVLVSMRNASAAYFIRRISNGTLDQDGPILWKMRGCGNGNAGADGEPVLSMQSDPEGCFDAQHDARFQPNGDVSLYDDHSYQSGGGARGVEYSIDTQHGTATWQWQYPPSPQSSPVNAGATGSFRRYAGGADNLIGWGVRTGSGFTEVDQNGSVLFSMTFPNGEVDYRVVKTPLSSLNLGWLRATAGPPRPVFPTVAWQSLDGVLTSKPAVAAWSPNRLDAFGRGTDGQLWHRWWDGTSWQGWESLGGQLYPGTGPAVAAWGPGRLDVFVDGTDQQLWHLWYDSAGWHGWEALGGALTSGPAASSWGAGRLDIVVAGTDEAVWHKWFDAGRWNGWESLGGQTNTDPAIASWGAHRVDVFVEGIDEQLQHNFYDGIGWHGTPWEDLLGNLTSGPSAASIRPNLVDAVAAGSGGEPERLPYNAGWQIWQPLSGQTAQAPSVVPFSGGEDVFATGTDSALWFGAVSPAF